MNNSLVNKAIINQVTATLLTSITANIGEATSVAIQSVYSGTTPGAKTFASGVADVQTITFPAKAGATAGDYIVINDANGASWAAALNVAGTDPAPTGPIWVAIPSGKKTNVDISGQTTAAQVATAVKTALNLLTGFTAIITASDAGADGTLVCTQALNGVVTADVPHNADDTGAGSITAIVSTAGTASKVSISADTISITAHGYLVGTPGQLTTTGTLPAGLSTSTTYYVIVVDANTIKFATSLANANAGTAINLTSQGSSGAVNTFTPTTFGGSLQYKISNDGTNWTAKGSPVAISAAGSTVTEWADVGFCFIQAVYTPTGGNTTLLVNVSAK